MRQFAFFWQVLALFGLLLLGRFVTQAQSVGIGTTSPDASAALDITSTTRGLLLPRLTATQRTTIASPAEGLLVSQTNLVKGPYYFDGSAWVNLITATTGPATDNTGASTLLTGQTEPDGTDGGSSTAASFTRPTGLALDGSGNQYVVEQYNYALRAIALGTGAVMTATGGSTPGFADGVGAAARFSSASGVAADASGRVVYIADQGNRRIRKLVVATRTVTTLAGTGASGRPDGAGTVATFGSPTGVARANDGNLYEADQHNYSIRRVAMGTGAVSTLHQYSTSPANMQVPNGMAVDASGAAYFALASHIIGGLK